MTQGSGDFSIGGKVWPGISKLFEEMGELQQVLGKLVGSHGDPNHYDGTNLRERLVEEIADLRAAIAFFIDSNLTDDEGARVFARSEKKRQLFEQWHREGK